MTIASRIRDVLSRGSTARRQQAYLEAATSLVDLEMRQREIDRGRLGR